MAPSTDQTLYYIYGKDGAVSAVLILVNAVIASALLLGVCAFWKIFKTKKVNFIESQGEKPSSELRRVTKQTEDKTRETNGTKNGAIPTGTGGESEEKGKGSKMSPRLENGTAHGSEKSEPNTIPSNLLKRVLPPPPENIQAALPASEDHDPLYDSVNDLKVVETLQNSARSNKEGTRDISKRPPENQGSPKVERINPLYVSADEVPHPPSFQKTTFALPSHEADEKKDDEKIDDEKKDDGKTQVVGEPLYAVIHKERSVKKTPPAQDPAGEKSPALQNVNCNDQRAEVNISMEQKTPEPSKIVDTMLSNWKKRSLKTAQLNRQDTTVNIVQEVPPLVPERHFDVESEF